MTLKQFSEIIKDKYNAEPLHTETYYIFTLYDKKDKHKGGSVILKYRDDEFANVIYDGKDLEEMDKMFGNFKKKK